MFTESNTPAADTPAGDGETNGFAALGLHAALVRAVADSGYSQPTEVQSRAIPSALQGQDLRVSSSTGSGKTASFVLPALSRVLAARGDGKRREKGVVHGPRVLVLAPTRELAMQVSKAASTYGTHVQGLRVATVVGGVPYGAQLKALRGPLDVLIATPGRLMDHMASGKAILANVELLVLDEADRMLDMGFIDDIRHIAESLPEQRQTMMFSATFAGHVGRLASELLRDDAQTIDVASHTDTHENIEQRLHWADNGQHKNALLDHILADRDMEQAVVFTSTQRDADWLADRLADMGHHVASLHGGMPQGRRNRVLQGLRTRHLRVLVATDVAARGIDVPTISHVINYGLPMKAEDYVHRIGRTGRAGRNGLAITLAEAPDAGMIRRIQQFTTQQIPVATIEGLEPQKPAPRLFAQRREGFGGDRPRGRPFNKGGFRSGGGDRPAFGGPRSGGGFKSSPRQR
ncbi:DEAD/DEAH box helicase [Aquincola tertiaricarbonis]|uniref:DEAD/DEAH box helicase n=1 Tax=Aquincola tertiaricarbonis TaxID=391953 RepID=A0ABY4SDJ6_AQUTE|nr:DEAD/DEAH box helicase [Aquincola tertiaricarbonis]URI11392.1 DEAD/DEAH box helicase [Aquincola tertiaricarbonis]